MCLSACGDDPEDLRPLLGDGDLPVVTPSATETVRVTLVNPNDGGSSNLDVIVTPDQKLLARHYTLRWQGERREAPRVTAEVEESLSLSDEAATDLRRRLAVFRPAELNRDSPFVMPKDCGFTYHGTSKAVVEFHDNKGAAGLFILQANCENSNAKKLANALRGAVASLPPNKIAANFRW
jgi:hypothetical protein